jgi:hypothetical protein
MIRSVADAATMLRVIAGFDRKIPRPGGTVRDYRDLLAFERCEGGVDWVGRKLLHRVG